MKLNLNKLMVVALLSSLSLVDCFAVIPEEYQFSDSVEENLQRWKDSGKETPEQWVDAVMEKNYTDLDRLPALVMVPEHWGNFLKKQGFENVIPTQPCEVTEDVEEQDRHMEHYEFSTSGYGFLLDSLNFLQADVKKRPIQNANEPEKVERAQIRSASVRAINRFFHVCGQFMDVDEASPYFTLRVRGEDANGKRRVFLNKVNIYSSMKVFFNKIVASNKNILEEREKLGLSPLEPQVWNNFSELTQERTRRDEELKGKSLSVLSEMKTRQNEILRQEIRQRASYDADERIAREQEAARVAAEEAQKEEVARKAAEEARRKAAEEEAARRRTSAEETVNIAAAPVRNPTEEDVNIAAVPVRNPTEEDVNIAAASGSNPPGFFNSVFAYFGKFLKR